MNIMDKTTAKISLHIDGMTWEQVREMIEERYGALMWDHKSTAYPTDSVVVRMAFAEPAGNVAQRAIGKAAPQQEAQVELDAARYRWLTADHHKQEDRVRVYEVASSMNVRGKGHIDAAIDAARAAQEGKSHD